ncbi:hypothetical protein [Ammoniphilus sp. 3BR4]|uniref:hypothetical protein n=1 Tax=Ammoniphilus sp. 3BR4 TaxID=3158265 RepID=UPI003466659E
MNLGFQEGKFDGIAILFCRLMAHYFCSEWKEIFEKSVSLFNGIAFKDLAKELHKTVSRLPKRMRRYFKHVCCGKGERRS